MTTSHKKFARPGEIAIVRRTLILCFVLAPLCVGTAQQGKNTSAKGSVAGRCEGTAKNRAEEVINVTFELTEAGDQVRLVLTHRRLSGRDEQLNVAGGWHAAVHHRRGGRHGPRRR